MSNINGLWLDKDGKKICYCPWTHFEISNPNGDVTMCPDNPIVLGNVNEESILDIWNGQRYRDARKKMFEIGGEKMCSPNCLLLNGAKDYQSFSWYKGLPKDSEVYRNAVLSEAEILEGRLVLESLPRWMRFTISYKCNFRCYHCYQAGERGGKEVILNENFLSEMKKYISYYQYLFIFGGEPTILPQFKEILQLSRSNPHMKLVGITNASTVDKCYDDFESANWAYVNVSLDAASEKTFRVLRNPRMWHKVISNIRLLSELGKKKNFKVNVSMTLNSVNCHELYEFFRLCSSMGTMPETNLVSNAFGPAFQIKYLWFTEKQRKHVLNQIRAISNNFGYTKNESGIGILERHFDKSPAGFRISQLAELTKHLVKSALPGFAFKWLKKLKKKIMAN